VNDEGKEAIAELKAEIRDILGDDYDSESDR